jgi:hypothetical protein
MREFASMTMYPNSGFFTRIFLSFLFVCCFVNCTKENIEGGERKVGHSDRSDHDRVVVAGSSMSESDRVRADTDMLNYIDEYCISEDYVPQTALEAARRDGFIDVPGLVAYEWSGGPPPFASVGLERADKTQLKLFTTGILHISEWRKYRRGEQAVIDPVVTEPREAIIKFKDEDESAIIGARFCQVEGAFNDVNRLRLHLQTIKLFGSKLVKCGPGYPIQRTGGKSMKNVLISCWRSDLSSGGGVFVNLSEFKDPSSVEVSFSYAIQKTDSRESYIFDVVPPEPLIDE